MNGLAEDCPAKTNGSTPRPEGIPTTAIPGDQNSATMMPITLIFPKKKGLISIFVECEISGITKPRLRGSQRMALVCLTWLGMLKNGFQIGSKRLGGRRSHVFIKSGSRRIVGERDPKPTEVVVQVRTGSC